MKFCITSRDFITVVILILGVNVYWSECYKVLLLPLPTKSHVFSLTSIGEELVRRGHEAHMLVAKDFPISSELTANNSVVKTLRFAPQIANGVRDHETFFEIMSKGAMSGEVGILEAFRSGIELVAAHCRSICTQNEKLFEEMAETRYDIAVVDSTFVTDYLYLVPHRLGIPWITYTDFLDPWTVRVPWLPSFYKLKITPFSGELTFWERLLNTLISFLIGYFADPPNDIVDDYQQYGDFSSMNDLTMRSLLFVITSDVVLDEPLPYLLNMISAGGLTVKPNGTKALPKEFEDFILSAKSGAVIVSFGTTSSVLPKTIAQEFIDVFSCLPDFTFVWRLKNVDNLPLPKNVMISKWLPQNDLLAHPRTKLFITHSGNNGQFEAVYHGVPMIGFPLVGDQRHNAKRLESKGYGISMSIHHFTVDELFDNVKKILSDPNYKKRVNLASEIFKSALRSPAERVVDGMEHVLKFGGDHLKTPGNSLNLFQYLMLDVLALLFVVCVVVIAVAWKIFRFLIKQIVRIARKSVKIKTS